MRTKQDAFIFPPSVCALGAFTPEKCLVLYEKWCRGCNLVFCNEHADPFKHNCREKPGIIPLFPPINTKTEPEKFPKKEPLVITKKALVNGGVIWLVRRTIGEVGSKMPQTAKDYQMLDELNGLLSSLEQVAYHESQGKKTPREQVDELHRTAMRLLGAEPENESDPLFDKRA